jgi:predicted amino acid dehydrogenase
VLEISARLARGTAPESLALGGIAQTIYADLILPGLSAPASVPAILGPVVEAMRSGRKLPADAGSRLDRALAESHGTEENPLITVGGIDDLAECDIVAIATNSTNTQLVGPGQVKKGAIVGCASVPSNLNRSFFGQSDDYFVFDGGYARLPEGGEIEFVGMPRDGLAFGCLSETLLLGFEGLNRSFAKGPIQPAQVLETLRMAEDYGFTVGDFQLDGQTQYVT